MGSSVVWGEGKAAPRFGNIKAGFANIKASVCKAGRWAWLIPDKTALGFARQFRQWLRAWVEEQRVKILWRRLHTKETLPLPSSSAHIKTSVLSHSNKRKNKINLKKYPQTNKKPSTNQKTHIMNPKSFAQVLMWAAVVSSYIRSYRWAKRAYPMTDAW